MTTHTTHAIEVTDELAMAADRDTIGGAPHLRACNRFRVSLAEGQGLIG
jgi:hypothetical protein